MNITFAIGCKSTKMLPFHPPEGLYNYVYKRIYKNVTSISPLLPFHSSTLLWLRS